MRSKRQKGPNTVGHHRWRKGPINSNLVDDIGYIIPFKFCQIPFSVCRWEVQNYQQIRGHGSHLCWRVSPKSTNVIEDVEYLLPVKFRQSVQRLQVHVVDDVKMSQPIRGLCCHRSAQKSTIVDIDFLIDVKFPWTLFWYFRRSRKCEKLRIDGQKTDRQCVITIRH